MKKIRVFTELSSLEDLPRKYQSGLIKPFTGTSEFNKELKARLEDFLILVDKPENADVAFLPKTLNYYVFNNKWAEVERFSEKTLKQRINILAFNMGDSPVDYPAIPNLKVFMSGGYRSKRKPNEYTKPVFITDRYADYYKKGFETIKKSDKPSIGFCGHADATPWKVAGELLKTGKQNAQFRVGLTKHRPEKWLSEARIRKRVLNELKKSEGVETDFIIRKHYGAHNKKDRAQLMKEFFNNIKGNHFTVAVRGGGNFSVRFYETMMMGRIPYFIDTDCGLPFDHRINYREMMPMHDFDRDGTKGITEKLVTFYDELSEKDLTDRMHFMRSFWNEKFSPEGFVREVLSDEEIMRFSQ